MPLKPCKECGREISTDATACPHCGRKSPTTSRGVRLLGCLVVFVLIVVIAIYVTSSTVSSIDTALKPRPYTITITCSPSMPFTGSYLTVDASGASSSHDILGPCPRAGRMVITGESNMVSAQAQKSGEGGTLRMALSVGGKGPVVSETTQPYGIVTAAQ